MEPAKRSHSTACATSFFDMRSYKIESYVPEKGFLAGKDAYFCRTAFEDCFVVDLHNTPNIIASCKGTKQIETSMADTAALLTLFDGRNEFLILPCSLGTLLIYPAWQHLEMALAFLFKEDAETIEKAYQNAKRYAFSAFFNTQMEHENSPLEKLETKIRVLDFYMRHLFGAEQETNVTAQILMIANLVGCDLHKTDVSRVNVTLDKTETEKINAYLCCVFMTMRRYNGCVSTVGETDTNPSILTHVPQEYGICVQQSVRKKVTKPSAFDLPSHAEITKFFSHPAFTDCRIEETDGTLCLHLPIKQKARLSSVCLCGTQNELVLTLFPL